jgi:hypothetical protein
MPPNYSIERLCVNDDYWYIHNPFYSFMISYRICFKKSNTTGGTNGAGTVYNSWAKRF